MANEKTKTSLAAFVGVVFGASSVAAWNNREELKEKAIDTQVKVNDFSSKIKSAYNEMRTKAEGYTFLSLPEGMEKEVAETEEVPEVQATEESAQEPKKVQANG